jgi:uncharacterized membrane protein
MASSKNKNGDEKWYSSIARRIGKGIVQFLIPIIIVLFICKKAISIAQSIMQPIKSHLPTERIFGVGMFSLICVLFILAVCYIAGLVSDRKNVKSFLSFIEDNLLIYIPGYAMMKSSADATIKDADNNWKAVLTNEDDDPKLGIEVDKRPDGYSMIFFPEPPDAKSGEMKLMAESKFERIDFPVNKLEKIIMNYGHGSADIPKPATVLK